MKIAILLLALLVPSLAFQIVQQPRIHDVPSLSTFRSSPSSLVIVHTSSSSDNENTDILIDEAVTSSNCNNNNTRSDLIIPSSRPHLIFPGGGIFFYWQAGAVTYLREQGYDLSQVTASGASAGALTATLLTTNVCFKKATQLALHQASEAGIWNRSSGLQGIWGPLIYDWLDELISEEEVKKVIEQEGKLSLLVTPVPSFGKNKITTFENKTDLIQCNMASVHLVSFVSHVILLRYLLSIFSRKIK